MRRFDLFPIQYSSIVWIELQKPPRLFATGRLPSAITRLNARTSKEVWIDTCFGLRRWFTTTKYPWSFAFRAAASTEGSLVQGMVFMPAHSRRAW